MAFIDRYRILWTGFQGAPGISTLYFNSVAGAVGPLYTFMAALRPMLPPDVTLNTPTSGDTIDVLTGEIRSTWTDVTHPALTGNGADNYLSAAGGQIKWDTDTIIGGRHLRGRTFLVPLSATIMGGEGGLNMALVTTPQAELDTFVTAVAANMVIYQRPRPATPSWTDVHGRLHPAKSARVGFTAPVIKGTIPTKGVVLRSRRD